MDLWTMANGSDIELVEWYTQQGPSLMVGIDVFDTPGLDAGN
jgi:hypothetical protein